MKYQIWKGCNIVTDKLFDAQEEANEWIKKNKSKPENFYVLEYPFGEEVKQK